MEHKAVYANLFVSSNAYFVNQAFFVAKGTQGRQEPAVAVKTLTNIASARALFKENGVFEDILRRVRNVIAVGIWQGYSTLTGIRFTDLGYALSST